MKSTLKGIVTFNQERGLHDFDRAAESRMLMEELQEFIEAPNEHETIDALCDLIVVATGGLYKLGYDPDHALQETLKEINSRQGVLNIDTGKWEKDKNQDPSTLYKAVYKPAVETL